MEAIELKVKVRTKVGGSFPHNMRKEGIVPGIIYGKNVDSVPVEVHRGDLEHAFRGGSGENIMIDLKFEDGPQKNTMVMITDVQHDILTDRISHVDFKVVSLTETVTITVHIHTKGEAPGIGEGGILDIVHREVEVECLPKDIPSRIDVDVSGLGINDSLTIADLKMPENVTCLEDPEATVVHVLPPRLEEEEEAKEEEEEITEPEVISRKKEESGEASSEE